MNHGPVGRDVAVDRARRFLHTGGRRLARIERIRPLWLEEEFRNFGGYELVFGLDLAVNAFKDRVRRASIIGARVTVRPREGEPQVLGFARSEGPLEVVCRPFSSREVEAVLNDETGDLKLSTAP